MLAYNLIRQVMFEAAKSDGLYPWQISFKGTLSTLAEMLPTLSVISNVDELCNVLYQSCQWHRVGDRPD